MRAVPGRYVNTGYSGHGIMASPGGARLLPESLIVDSGVGEDNPFRLERFVGATMEARSEKMVI